MTTAVSEDWGDVVETLRSDLEVVSSEDAEDGDVRAAIDEVWAIVDAAQERVGSVDPEQIGDVLGVDGGADAIDAGSISREFVLDDPQRAARLGRLVALINVDEATQYDVGRLWQEEEGDGDGSDDGDAGGGTDAGSRTTEESAADSSAGEGGEAIRAQLGDALSQLRDKVEDARDGLDASTDRADEAGGSEGGGAEDTVEGSGRGGSSGGRRSRTSNRSATAFSTVPSNRRDIGGRTRLSTVPGRHGRSSSSNPRTLTGDDDGEERTDWPPEERDEE